MVWPLVYSRQLACSDAMTATTVSYQRRAALPSNLFSRKSKELAAICRSIANGDISQVRRRARLPHRLPVMARIKPSVAGTTDAGSNGRAIRGQPAEH
jgi:hypothetical protein